MGTVGTINHQVRLASRPVGLPSRATWQFTEEALPDASQLADGDVLVKSLALLPAGGGRDGGQQLSRHAGAEPGTTSAAPASIESRRQR